MAARGLCWFGLFCVLACVCAQNQPTNFTQSAIGHAGSNTIWYQSDNGTFLSWGNIQNPVEVSIVYNSGSTVTNATVCVNSYASSFPISGINLNSTCPSGAVGIVSNATEIILPTTTMDSTNFTSETFTASVYVKPTTEGGFIAVLPELVNTTQSFMLTVHGVQCPNDYYPIGTSMENLCESIPTIEENTERIFSLEVGEWKYFQMNSGVLNNSTNTVYLFSNDSNNARIYTQSGYYPTESWYLPTYDEDFDNNIRRSSILTPGDFNEGENYYFGITNIGENTISLTFNVTTSACANFTVFGLDCAHYSGQNLDPHKGVFLIHATLSNPNATNATTNNVGSAFSYQYDDDGYEGDYAYFTIDNYPEYPTPYYIRVTVANNDVTDSNGAPALYAKRGGYPSAQSNNYNISTIGDVVHQAIIRVDAEDLATPIDSVKTWYFAVPLPSDFSIWVGSNCEGNCNNQEYGVCMCDSITCQNATSNFQNGAAFYKRPSSLLDSGGACECVDDDYDSSFNCSEVNYPSFWVWITLICIIAATVLAIAIGVPIICFLTNRKAKHATFESIE